MLKLIIGLIGSLFLFPVFALECERLKPADNPDISYQLREAGTRCEGFYRSNVGHANLEVVSLLYTPLQYDLSKDKALHIRSPKIKTSAVLIQAIGIPLKLYYRMDAQIAPGKSLHWPLMLLKQEKIQARSLGLFGRLAHSSKVFVPLQVQRDGELQKPVSQTLTLSLRSSVDVEQLRWRYASVRANNCHTWHDWIEVSPPYGRRFRSGRAMNLTLPSMKGQQMCVEVAAQSRNEEWLKQLLRIQLNN